MSDKTIIELKDVIKVYKRGREEVYALDGISLVVKQGEFLAVVGPSGSGKTTLLNIIGCVDNPTTGTVKINGLDVSREKEKRLARIRRNSIGFVFQQFFLIPTLTALENVQIPGLFARNRDRVKRAEELLNLVGLKNRRNHLPVHLSGGEMQRVAIARSLINSPRILLADEPTGNLDSKNAEVIFRIFEELNKDGLTIIVVTHNMGLAKISQKVILLEDGRLKDF